MNRLILASLAGVSLLVLAACGEGEKSESAPASTGQTETAPAPSSGQTETAPADTTPAAPADTAPADTAPADTAPADTAPADTAPGNDQGQIPALPDADQATEDDDGMSSGGLETMTPEQIEAAVASARTEAEAAATAAGRSAEEIKQLGDQAEAAAKKAFGIE